jgi:hypothetical protein
MFIKIESYTSCVTFSSENVSLRKFGLFESAKPAENLAQYLYSKPYTNYWRVVGL